MPTTRRVFLYPPLTHQTEILTCRSRFVVVCAGRRSGKTALGTRALACGWPGARGALGGARAWYVTPTYPMATDVWIALKAALREVIDEKNEMERRLILLGGGRVEVRSADDPDRLRGAGLDLVVLDETAHIPKGEELWREVLRPALSDRQGGALLLSTPRGPGTWFHRTWEAAACEPDWARFHRTSASNPLVTAEELASVRHDIGSFAFAQEHLAEFVQPEGSLIRAEWLKRAPVPPLDELIRVAAADLACSTKTMADYTAVAVLGYAADGRTYVLDLVRARVEGPELVPLLAAVCRKWGVAVLGVEKAGFQLAIVQEARRAGLPVRELAADRDKIARAIPLTAVL